jgi:hypothetical protein
MRSSSALAIAIVLACATSARAQNAEGFGVERLYRSAPGGGWFVMDALDIHGAMSGAMSMSLGYAHDSLVVRGLPVITDQATTDFGFAFTYDRLRLSLAMDLPLYMNGQSGTVDGWSFTAPRYDLGTRPDTLYDARLGFDARIWGGPHDPFRFGAGLQLVFPNVSANGRSDYITDGSFRALVRFLFAGDIGAFTWAGHVGVHVRSLDDYLTPESPRGSEFLYGVAGGARIPLGSRLGADLIIGPEIFGATAFSSPDATSLEGLMTARVEGNGHRGPQIRIKVGAGAGLVTHVGEPEWRLVFGVEIFDHNAK